MGWLLIRSINGNFTVAQSNMRHSQMILRVHVPEQNMDISIFHGADQIRARAAYGG
jgi:hypothetical protein